MQKLEKQQGYWNLGSLDYLELSEREVLDLAEKNNKKTIEIAMTNEYKETSYIMKSNSISHVDLQQE